MMDGNLPELPNGWVWTTLGEIVEDVEKINPKDEPNMEFFYLDIASIDNNRQKIKEPKVYLGKDAPSRARQLVKSGDILFSTVRTYLKNIALVEEKFSGQIASTGFCVIRPFCLINNRIIYYLVQTDTFLNSLTCIQRGTSYPAVRNSDVLSQIIPLPPFPEQERIVAKIEELFTELDAGIEALKKVKTQLKRYRQAVLKYAFEGKLTEEWREIHRDELEPASVLLERIKEERKKNAKKKYKELPPVDISNLPDLPSGWEWTRVFDISETVQYGTSEKATSSSSGIPILRMGNIQDGKLDFEDLKYFPEDWPQFNKFVLQDGDVLFNRTNSAELVGKTAVYKTHHPKALFASYLIRVEVNDNLYLPDILSFFINSFYGRKYIASVISQQVGQANVNGRKLSSMPMPLLSILEQQKIVEEIEQRFSVADEIEKTVEHALKQAERLRQSILKRAFEGKLVPQNPDDESASILFERIKAEKAKKESKKTKKTRKSKKNSEKHKQKKVTNYGN